MLDHPIADWTCETTIDGTHVGKSDASSMPGGPVESVRNALEITARRGMPLKKGMFISTGAVTGVHQASPGQAARIYFPGDIVMECALEDYSSPQITTD